MHMISYLHKYNIIINIILLLPSYIVLLFIYLRVIKHVTKHLIVYMYDKGKRRDNTASIFSHTFVIQSEGRSCRLCSYAIYVSGSLTAIFTYLRI